MNIFDNDHQALQIGGLTIENGTDSVRIMGDVVINKTQAGREQAMALYEFACALMARFDTLGELPICLPNDDKSKVWVANPFE